MNDPLKSVRLCREITSSFVAREIDYAEFRSRTAAAMGALDPLDWALDALDTDAGREAAMYVEWLGGEFGESESRIPTRPGWRYGQSDRPYDWVDQEAYRSKLREAFREILDLPT